MANSGLYKIAHSGTTVSIDRIEMARPQPGAHPPQDVLVSKSLSCQHASQHTPVNATGEHGASISTSGGWLAAAHCHPSRRTFRAPIDVAALVIALRSAFRSARPLEVNHPWPAPLNHFGEWRSDSRKCVT